MVKRTGIVVGFSVAAVALLVGLAETQGPRPGMGVRIQPTNLGKLLQVSRLGTISLRQTDDLSSLTDLKGQLFGAGRRKVVALDENGNATQVIATEVDQPSISPHAAGELLLGDRARKTLMTLDVKTGAVRPMLSLGEVQDPEPGAQPERSLLATGDMMGVASNGKQVYVAVGAGFSSAIFKIDPATKRIVGRAWATAADPQAMTFHNGGLYVLVGGGSQVRRFTDGLLKSHDHIDLPAEQARGLGIREGELRVLTGGGKSVARYKIDPSVLSVARLANNLDRLQIRPNHRLPKDVILKALSDRYAVLICGDLAENFWGECFWNDTVWMYKALLANGYKPENVFVLYGDGADYLSAAAAYKHSSTVTDFAATPGNVDVVFDGLKNGDEANGIPKMTANDTLFVWTFDHGGGNANAVLCLRGGNMTDTHFAAKLDAIPYKSRAIFMQQCRSGGFIDNLQNAKTFISTACTATQNAQPSDTENEMVGGKTYSHGEYNFHVISALNRLNATGGAVNADGNADKWVSTLEAHQWNVSKESLPETPQMSDMGGIGGTFRMKK